MTTFFHAAFSPLYTPFAFFFLLGLVDLAIVYTVYRIRQKRLQNGEETTGQVVDIISKKAAKGGDVYYPVFRFKTYQNKVITYKSNFSSKPSPYKIGDEVTVVYDPEKPERFLLRNDKRYRFLFYIFFSVAIGFFLLGVTGLWPLLKRYF